MNLVKLLIIQCILVTLYGCSSGPFSFTIVNKTEGEPITLIGINYGDKYQHFGPAGGASVGAGGSNTVVDNIKYPYDVTIKWKTSDEQFISKTISSKNFKELHTLTLTALIKEKELFLCERRTNKKHCICTVEKKNNACPIYGPL